MKTKSEVFAEVQSQLNRSGFTIEKIDTERPWGGFFVIAEAQAQKFSNHFFNGLDTDDLKISGKLSPKILIVEPGKRLSWQYHHRREEIWKVESGPVAIIKSMNDEETEAETYEAETIIKLRKEERHRLIGLDNWGVLAEIWQHTDSENPSDENDIVRVQDDFGR